ncbi:LytTR family DNA-binding domain-containing protein [Emticicia agri]|uniref:LytTR family transcriptional regulator n=1 Tax=Emticicia agri TaxID=2492393 RepID=A0A4Q5M4K5_9BACT|nr:LytTR family DNA-binding domain-containing protein [Emticicia agri]RYU97308.1 LytTR family transcriptional regulator [Emticicia agri]
MNEEKIAIGARMSVDPENIVLLKANQNYTQLYLDNGRMLIVATTLKVLEQRFLTTNSFYRLDRAHMVNLSYMKNYEVNVGKVIMKNHQEISISRRRRNGFDSFLNEHYNPFNKN